MSLENRSPLFKDVCRSSKFQGKGASEHGEEER